MSMVAIEFKFPSWEKKLKTALDEIHLFVAAMMQTNRGMLFDAEGAYNGHDKWAPLKFRMGHILKLTGTLSKSIGPMSRDGRPMYGQGSIVRISGDVITIGTTLAYARLMNDGTAKMPGGKLTAPSGQAFAIPIPSGAKIEKGKKYEVSKAKNEQQVRDIVGKAERLKELRKHASGQKEFAKKIKRLEAQIEISKRAGDRKKTKALQEKHSRWASAMKDSPKDQRVIFRKSVRIPARPFDQWNEADQAELDAALTNKLVEVLNR